jgi:hypothetical protein
MVHAGDQVGQEKKQDAKKEAEAKRKEGGEKGKEGGGKKRPSAVIFQAIDERAGTVTVKASEKGNTTHPLANPFKVLRQGDEGKTIDGKVGDLKTGLAVNLKLNAEGKAVEAITILRKGRPEGKEAPAPKRPEGKEAPAPKRPEGKEAPAPKSPDGKEAPAPKRPEGKAAPVLRRPEGL